MTSVVERVAGRHGELVLRRDGRDWEIISNGLFLMDTRDGRSERLLARAAVGGIRPPGRVLLGGLGVGFSLAEALRCERVAAVTVVEIEAAVIGWHRTHLRACSGDALADPRVELVHADLAGWLARSRRRFEAICLDVDNGPAWTVSAANARLYRAAWLRRLHDRLTPGGALAVWSAWPVPAFEARLRRVFPQVTLRTVDARRGAPDAVYLARRA
jgi:spermidine synthase